MREEIVSGLKNAIERGATLEQAVRSFINAGYNPVEVEQAAQTLRGSSAITSPQEVRRPIQQPQQNPYNYPPQQFQQKYVPSQQKQYPPQNQQIPQQPLQSYPSPQQIKPLPSFQYPRKKKSYLLLAVIILLIVLFILIGALVYVVFFGKDLIASFFSK